MATFGHGRCLGAVALALLLLGCGGQAETSAGGGGSDGETGSRGPGVGGSGDGGSEATNDEASVSSGGAGDGAAAMAGVDAPNCLADDFGCIIGEAWTPDADDPCSMQVPTPTSGVIDLNAVDVGWCYGDLSALSPWVPDPASCIADGWYYLPDGPPYRVKLCDSACELMQQLGASFFLALDCGVPSPVM